MKPEERATIENVRKVLKKMHKCLEVGNDEHSELIDLVNHAETLVQCLEDKDNE